MNRTVRQKQLEAMNHSPVGFAELHRIWTAMRDRLKLVKQVTGIPGSTMVVEILQDEFPEN